jgi:hypothetical protein
VLKGKAHQDSLEGWGSVIGNAECIAHFNLDQLRYQENDKGDICEGRGLVWLMGNQNP